MSAHTLRAIATAARQAAEAALMPRKGTPDRVSWQSITAAKASLDAVLLYVSTADVLPFHRAFFAEGAWEPFVTLTKSKVRRWQGAG